MGDVLLKLDDALLMDYRRAADSSGRTLEDELREALTAHRPTARLSKQELLALSDRLLNMTPASAAAIDSTDLIREDRDSR
ncbi:hypothetical protein [Sphingomonas adhaesiva]|uniref:hypothetical protein n=1 Tax=Sphingomonas adhaesiva TaxID=28212 RepID=UPI002FF7F48D